MSTAIQSFHYRLAHPGYNVFPGAHPAQMVGSGQLFKRHQPLLASPDPRRIDLRASLLDPFQQYRVRVFQQHSKLSVYVIADLSASMTDKLPAVGEFVLSAGQSALQIGDNFGFIGCGLSIDHQWILPAGPAMQPVRELVHRLQRFRGQSSADSLSKIISILPNKRCLLFLVTDGHFSIKRLQAILQPLTQHAVVPMVWWDTTEYSDLPDWGLVRFKDAESRRSRTLLMRPALKQRVIQAFERRRLQLRHSFRAFGMEPLFLTNDYRAETLNRYFQQQAL
ncbi:MAG: MxaS protein [Methylomonas lenta]|nr:MxaS protein [Methylomonas lenta]